MLMWDRGFISREKALGKFFSSLFSNSFHVSPDHCQPVQHPEMASQMRVLDIVCGTLKFTPTMQVPPDLHFESVLWSDCTDGLHRVAPGWGVAGFRMPSCGF